MKKIVLLLAVGLLFATYANAEEVVVDEVTVAVKTADGVIAEDALLEEAAEEEVVFLDEHANDENWEYHKFQTLNAIKEVNEKIEAAQKANKPTAELEAQKNELFKKLNELDEKILAEGKNEEMKKARAEAEKNKTEEAKNGEVKTEKK